jgi:hypothetical protein
MTRRVLVAAILSFSLNPILTAQEELPKPVLSNHPLTADEVAIFRAVLKGYLKGSRGVLLLADATTPIEQSPTSVRTCAAEISARLDPDARTMIHHIEPSVIAGLKIKLVDPSVQDKEVKQNDPQRVIHQAIDEGMQVTNKQLDDSLTKAFASGLFTLSEIVFNPKHVRAVVTYSFYCGSLCGNGNTLTLKKVGKIWRVSKHCGGWVS